MPGITQLVLATHNRDKVVELRESLHGLPIQILSLDHFPNAPEVEEDGDTLEANAIKKALAIHAHTQLPAVADDTGLMVDTLNGAPGVYSSRYAGPQATYADNVQKLLRELAGVPELQRRAEFRTVMALVCEGKTHLVEGRCCGRIMLAPRGKNGFGYDPVFFVPELNKTFAELALAEKNKISHRGKATEAFKTLLTELNF